NPFRNHGRHSPQEKVNDRREDCKRLGVVGDWDHPYLTMDFVTEANIIRALGKIVDNGHLYKGYKPVHWCLDCGSALAEAEVEYQDRTSPAIDVRFRVVDERSFLSKLELAGDGGKGPVSVAIWTTTPWTLPANQAVAIHPEFDYALVEFDAGAGVERVLF